MLDAIRSGLVSCLVVLTLASLPTGRVAAADADGDGLDDATEVALVSRFAPSFILHDLRPVEPEPADLLTRGDCLRARDLFMTTYDLNDGYRGTFNVCEVLDADSRQLTLCTDPEYNYADLDDSWALRVLRLPGMAGTLTLKTKLHWEYGGHGNESGPAWAADYLGVDASGAPHTNPWVFPGDQRPPTVYATVFPDGGSWHVQYWMYYPYNDWIGNHEGDWESVVVTIDSTDPASAEIAALRFYVHEFFIDVAGAVLDDVHVMAETHPVLYVGGSGEGPCGVGDGEGSGASWPAPGDWLIKELWPCADIVESIHPGRFIPFEDVRAEWWPGIRRIGSGGPGVDAAYFANRVCSAWQRTDMPWGRLESPSPGDWIPGLDAGNLAPSTPPYQGHWQTLSPSGFESFPFSRAPLWNQPEALFLVLEAGDGGSVPGEVVVNGQARTAPLYQSLANGYQLVDVTIPDRVVRDGAVLPFGRWSDGSTARTRQFGTAETLTLRAQYGDLPCDDVPQTIITSNSQGAASPTNTCPAGDGDDVVVTVRFNPNQVAGPLSAESITLAPVPQLQIWEELTADGPADATNNFTTTFTLGQVSGCASASLDVRLAGCTVGSAYVRAKSVDVNRDGAVNLLELGEYSLTHGTCFGDPGYDGCYDFNDDSCVDLVDLSIFSSHYGHDHAAP